ncbi:multiubiquitin domain-containing protein [Citromicrobium bathyomarinum]|uniref:multiubiquitin domain-containing protein n=1 Tax=Citromicrobium bathyomarinum TaxID=72174 RepID=UPI00261A51EC|nr:multiubiquitin domain-containing protein [uncultured Croceicoccus sp.]
MTNDKDKKEKETTVIVNGREKVVNGKEICFDELVKLAFDNPPTGQNICFTITYRKAMGNKPEGTLAEGECVKVKKGTIFNVTATDKS